MEPRLAVVLNACLLLTIMSHTSAASLYPKSSSVLNVDSKSYDRLIAKSNYTSIVEFYAPWCGHCQNLKPQYEKAATSLAGLAKVAAINCDDDSNKSFCGGMGIQGFPTLKLVKPPKKKGGKPSIEDYQGPRTAKGIKESVLERIPNHVTRVKDESLEKWLSRSAPKALFFSEKSLVSPLAKAIAIDFLGALDIGYARNADKEIVKRFGIKKFPAVVVIPVGGDPVEYDGEIKKAALMKFLSQAASPNPEALGPNAEGCPMQSKKASSKTKSKGDNKTVNVADDGGVPNPTAESVNPKVETDPEATPIEVPLQSSPSASPKPTLPYLETADSLRKACVHSKSSTCVLALLPESAGASSESPLDEDDDNRASAGPGGEAADELLNVLGEMSSKYKRRGIKIFPFYSLKGTQEGGSLLVDTLELDKSMLQSSPIVLAVNGKKGWYITYGGDTGSFKQLDDWVDAIRLGDVRKQSLPSGFVGDAETETEKEGRRKVEQQADDSALKVEFMEELSDEDVERLLSQAKAEPGGHDEL